MNRMFIFAALFISLTNLALAGVKVTSVDIKAKGANEHVSITLDGRSNALPDLKVNGKTIEITLTKADAFNSINKNINDVQISAVANKGTATVKALLPYNVSSEKVNLALKNNTIEVVFPRGKIVKAKEPAVVEIEKKIVSKVSKELLNEEYLNSLMKENTPAAASEVKKDEVKVQQAATARTDEEKKSSDGFSFAGYAAKFSVFLALVLGLFYGIVQLLKKGVFNKGKLGFLNNTQMIEVLSTTYVSPKRSLMLVKAHKQVFLVANAENGIQFLSEMKDTSGLIKEGEKFVTGSNFDTNFETAETDSDESSIKLKENIMESTPFPEDKGIAALSAKDIVKFSDELKKKAKKLKRIEFN